MDLTYSAEDLAFRDEVRAFLDEKLTKDLSDKIRLGGDLTIGLMKRMNDTPAKGSAIRGGTMTFDVADCDKSYALALENGGAEALPPTDYPGVGRCAYVEDGQGNVVGMISPAKGT